MSNTVVRPLEVPPPNANEVQLTVVSGPDKGVSYRLLGKSITLGRGDDNDVVLQDNRSSRNHARIEFREGQYWIVDMQSQNGIFLNNAMVRESALKNGDRVTIGDTTLRFGPPQSPSLINSAPPFDPSKMQLPPLTKKRNSTFFIALAVGAVLVFIFMKDGSSSKKSYLIKDDSVMDQKLETISENNEKQAQEVTRKGKNTQQYAEAQAFYLRGFRDFRESNFSRAIQNFEAALALFPDHPLAKRYLTRSRLKLDESITIQLTQAEKNFQLEKYNQAFNGYRTVMILTNDPNNKSYQLAQKRIDAINLIWMNNK